MRLATYKDLKRIRDKILVGDFTIENSFIVDCIDHLFDTIGAKHGHQTQHQNQD